MAFTYHDYPTYTGAARVTRLRLHVQEVGAAIAGPDVSSDGDSRSTANLVEYLKVLKGELAELENGPYGRRAGGLSKARFADESDFATPAPPAP